MSGEVGLYERVLDDDEEVIHYEGKCMALVKGTTVKVSYEASEHKIRFFVNGKAYGHADGYVLDGSVIYHPAVTVKCEEKATLEVHFG